MISFISAKNCPIYLNTTGENLAPHTGSDFFAATSAALSFESPLEANKVFGQSSASNDYKIGGPVASRLGFSFYPLYGGDEIIQGTLGFFGLTGDFNSGHNARFGNLELKKCYLDNYSLKIAPFAPIVVSANFSCFDASLVSGQTFTGENLPNSLTSGSGAYLSSWHAVSVGVSGSGLNLPESRAEIDIQVNCGRSPVYGLGNVEASTALLDSVERVVSIRGENIGQIVNFSGGEAIVNLRFSPMGAFITGTNYDRVNSYVYAMDVTGKVISQNLSADPDGFLNGEVRIVENLY